MASLAIPCASVAPTAFAEHVPDVPRVGRVDLGKDLSVEICALRRRLPAMFLRVNPRDRTRH
jgi:hypothetical protein